MARISYSDALAAEPGDLLAILASGLNPDGSTFAELIGGVYNSAPPTLSNLQDAPLQFGSRGSLSVQIMAKDAAGSPQATVDGTAGTLAFLVAAALFNGATLDRPRGVTVIKSRADASITAGTGATLWTPAAGKKPRILAGQLSLSVAGQILLRDNAVGGTLLIESPKLAAGGIWDFNLSMQMPPLIVSAANSVIVADVSATGTVGGWIGGTEE